MRCNVYIYIYIIPYIYVRSSVCGRYVCSSIKPVTRSQFKELDNWITQMLEVQLDLRQALLSSCIEKEYGLKSDVSSNAKWRNIYIYTYYMTLCSQCRHLTSCAINIQHSILCIPMIIFVHYITHHVQYNEGLAMLRSQWSSY